MQNVQRGTSYLAILVGIVVFALVAKATATLWPPYWDDRVLNEQIEALVSSSPANITPSQFIKQANETLEGYGLSNLAFEDVARVDTDNGLVVTKQYEVRRPFLFNIDLVLTFEKSFDQRSVQSK